MIVYMESPTPQRIHIDASDPLDLLAAWDQDRPVALVRSSPVSSGPWSRWSMIAEPRGHLRIDSKATWTGDGPPPIDLPSRVDDPIVFLQQVLDSTCPCRNTVDIPLGNGGQWLAILSYELGQVLEPAAIGLVDRAEKPSWPLMDLLWCPTALVHDGHDDEWWSIGEAVPPSPTTRTTWQGGIGTPVSLPNRSGYTDQVQRIVEYIHAGDVFQVNLSRRLRADVDISPRSLATEAMAGAQPRYGFYAELPGGNEHEDRVVLSLSPELFLQVEDGDVVTRPIKGTRPATASCSELADSEKDAAELHMIVDLMRNDLGRVCEPGSVHVVEGRTIESHPTVHHGVGEIRGRLERDTTVSDLLKATFPPGSITGAPKIRAMQIIHDLEPIHRGPYCGALGWLGSKDACLSVGIRTLAFSGRFAGGFTGFEGIVEYGTGGGIVSDSDPDAEYEETVHKAVVFEQLASHTTIGCT